MAVQTDPEHKNLLKTYLLKAKNVTAHWKMLGVFLGLDKVHLDGIEAQYHNVVGQCMLEMLDAWLKTNPSNTEEQLEDALKELSPVCRVRSAHHGDHPAATMTISSNTWEKIADFKRRYAFLTMEMADYLKKSYPDPETLMVLLNGLLKSDLKEPLMIEVPVTTYGELFQQLEKKWGFTNPTILQQLINYLAGEALQQKMREYSQEYDIFCQSLKIDESSLEKRIYFDDYDATNPCLIVIIESSQAEPAPSHLNTVELNEIYVFLDNVFGIYKRYLRIHKIERGCIKVTLQFPPSMKQLIEACINQKDETVKRYANMQLKLLTDVIEEP